jgi:ATP-dependent RNA helicase SUPV3L1/SUV3
MGWRALGPLVLRVDRLERLAAAARRLARQGPFTATPALADLAGTTPETLTPVLTALGYRAALGDAGATFHIRRTRRAGNNHRRGTHQHPVVDGPFAKLRGFGSAQ